jgi:hypothetical protein
MDTCREVLKVIAKIKAASAIQARLCSRIPRRRRRDAEAVLAAKGQVPLRTKS